MTGSTRLETLAERHLREYGEARERFEATRHIDDAMAAGRAWGRFIAEFLPEQGGVRELVHGENVVRMRK
jgi:thymidine phosphorylase